MTKRNESESNMKSEKQRKVPNSRRNLDMALQRLYGAGANLVQVRMAMANTIVGQMLPDVVIKGGTSLRLRYGRGASRYTIDCDVARCGELDAFIEGLRKALAIGWNGFSGDLVRREPARPKGIPQEYVMQPFDVKLTYLGRSWCTVLLEVGTNEVGLAETPEVLPVAPDIVELFTALGFPAPRPVPLMPLTFQIAQKLHGVSSAGSDRARDLIDIQLIMGKDSVDLTEVRQICERLFKYRKCQPWPPVITKGLTWDDLYNAQKGGLDVLPTCDEAVKWANELIASIVKA